MAERNAFAFVVLPLGVAAKLSMAKSEPTEQKAKASKARGLKNADLNLERGFFFMAGRERILTGESGGCCSDY